MSEKITLSAIDFLGLAETRQVIEVDLAEVGHRGVVFVRELTSAEIREIMGRPKGKTLMHKNQAIEIDWSQMPGDASAKFLKYCMVTDATGTKQMYDLWVEQLGAGKRPMDVMDKISQLPNSVVNLIVKKCREISGLVDDNGDHDEIEEKKGS